MPIWVYVLDYILGIVMYTLIGRAAMNIFQREDSNFFFMKIFVKFTNPVLKIFDKVTPDMDIYKQEIFGPVLSTVRTQTYEEALKLAMDHEYGNGTAIFTRDGDTARDFANRINIGMVGINVPIPVPLAYHTFGGWKKSAFGDLNQHGPDAFKFYTRTKTVTARWPSGIKEGGEFSIPLME